MTLLFCRFLNILSKYTKFFLMFRLLIKRNHLRNCFCDVHFLKVSICRSFVNPSNSTKNSEKQSRLAACFSSSQLPPVEQKNDHVFSRCSPNVWTFLLSLHDMCFDYNCQPGNVLEIPTKWWFQILFHVHPDPWGNGIQFDDHIFSDELKPPPIGPSGPRMQNLVATRMP